MEHTSDSGQNDSATARADDPSTDKLVGKVIDGKYRVISKLGAGGMGAVYKGEHSLMERAVAIKFLHSHLVENEELLKRFQSEARVASKLRHPNAITTYDFGIYEGAPYIVMEFVQGRSLRDLIASAGPLPVTKVKAIFEQVCSALEQAHDLGIVHRDLKPDNIMLVKQKNGNESAMVLDFGIAKVLTEQGNTGTVLTKAGTFFGTPRYASPEQALERALDRRADIYALGVILYEALSGDVPFDAPSIIELLSKHLNQEPVPLREFKPELKLPKEVDDLVMKCLRKKPEDRYQDLHELLEALRALPGIPSEMRSVPSGLNPVPPFPSPSGSRGPMVPVLGAIAVCIVGILAFLNWPGDPETKSELQNEENSQMQLAKVEEPKNDQKPDNLQQTTRNDPKPEVTERKDSVPEPEKGSPSAVFTGLFKALTKNSTSDTPPESPPPDGQNIQPPQDNSGPPQNIEQHSNMNSLPVPTPLQDHNSVPPHSNTNPDLTTTTDHTNVVSEKLALDAKTAKQQAIKLYDEGTKLLRQKKYAEAAGRFESAVALRSDAVGSLIGLGNCYLRLGQKDKSYQAFNRAVRVDPGYSPAHYNLAAYYALTGQSSSALQSLRTSIGLDPRAKREARREPDFAALQSLPEFQALVK